MVSGLVSEAIEIVESASKRIEEGVLSKSKDLRQDALSLAHSVFDIYSTLHKFFEKIGKVVSENKSEAVYRLKTRSFIVISNGELVYIKSKPINLAVSYSSGEKKVSVKSKRFLLNVFRDKLEASYYNLKVEINIGNPKDYIEKYSELRYVLNKIQKIISSSIVPVIHSKE
ncbi:MAG: hypothetical protein QXT88_00420 [Desulfurococcaceae archaeon]